MEKQRIFGAIPLSPELVDAVRAFLAPHRSLPVRWIPEQNWHLTVLEPQYWNDETTRQAADTLRHSLNVKPFSLIPELITGSFQQQPARMIWTLFKQQPAFTELKSQVVAILRDHHINVDIQRRNREIIHCTVARSLPDQEFTLQPLPLASAPAQTVSQVELWESTLLPSGAVYKPVATIPFLS
jgi:2'-5' RNA ligase